MKITILQGAFLPVPPIMGGAVEKQWFALGREIASRGHEVLHISRTHTDLPKSETLNGVRHLRVPGFETPKSLAVNKVLDLRYSLRARRVLPPADILVTNTFWMPVLVRDRKRGGVCVQVARYPRGQMKLYKHVARLHAVSKAIEHAILEQCPDCRPIVKTLSNFLGDAWTEPKPDLAIEREKSVLYVGRVHPEKGLSLLIQSFAEAVKGLPDAWRLEIVGPSDTVTGGGGQEYLDSLRKEAEALGATVDFVGPIFDHPKLLERYERAAIFAYPSLAVEGESFGLSPLEAMARGTPPIVSGLACFSEYLRPGENGIQFNHDSPNRIAEFAAKLRSMITDYDALMPVREQGLVTAAAFTAEKAADRYLADFEDVVAGKPAAS